MKGLELKKQKLFKDATQGYIKIDEVFVRSIIDTFEMQRLKDVAQTGIRSIYTGATHDRFSHSLGVYNIGVSVYDFFTQNTLNGIEALDGIAYEDRQELKKCVDKRLKQWKYLFHVACILHDIGHPALSHTFEDFYLADDIYLDLIDDTNSRIDRESYPREVKRISELCYAIYKENDDQAEPKSYLESRLRREVVRYSQPGMEVDLSSVRGAAHEMMGAYQILTSKIIRGYINEAITEIDEEEKPENIDDQSYLFMALMIVGGKYIRCKEDETYPWFSSLRNCVISLLNGRVDADNIDYLNRNSHFAGYSTWRLDIPRLTRAFSSVYIPEKKKFKICLDKSALSVIEGFINARNFEPKWLYSHHKVVYSGIFLYQFLFKKSCRMLFADEQEEWEKAVVECYKGAFPEDIQKEITDGMNDDCEQSKAIYNEAVFDYFLAIVNNDDWLNEKLEILLAYTAEQRKDSVIEILKDSSLVEKTTEGLNNYLFLDSFSKPALNSVYLLKDVSFRLLRYCGEQLEKQDSIDNVKALLEMIQQMDFTLAHIKNAYFAYILAPIRRFFCNGRIYYKSTDADINVLFKDMYFKYHDVPYEKLSENFKMATSKYEYMLFKQALEEFETRRYRCSLWKSEEEYKLFLRNVANECGLIPNDVGKRFVELIKTKGYRIDFDREKTFDIPDKKKKRYDDSIYTLYPHDVGVDRQNEFEEIFDFFGAGLIICIQKERFKDYSALELNFRSNVYTDGTEGGLAQISTLFESQKREDRVFPYIYYRNEDIQTDRVDKNMLAELLEKRLINYFQKELSAND